MKRVLDDENELNARVYQFPTSAIKENGRKINYYDFLMAAENKDCNKALDRIAQKIDINQIFQFIDHVPYISACIWDNQTSCGSAKLFEGLS